MASDPLNNGYNDRLFAERRLRSYYHLARFNWAEREISRLARRDLRVVELGCFDGRLVDRILPFVSEYVGIDANWEGGLDGARDKFADNKTVSLVEADSPTVLEQYDDQYFDVAVSLETLEHLPPELIPAYLQQLKRVTKGFLLVSIPNEIRLPFISKLVAKRLVYGGGELYSFKELVGATLGKTHLVERSHHKGFDYREMIGQIAEQFRVTKVEGLPPMGLPVSISPTVALVAAAIPHAR